MKIRRTILYNGRDTYEIEAEPGKELMRTSDGLLCEEKVLLGYTWYIGGKRLPEPKWEIPEDYEEIDLVCETNVYL